MNWFRYHTHALDNPKVQKLPPVLFKAWVNMLCLAKLHYGTLPDVEDIAFRLRVDTETAQAWLDELTNKHGLLDKLPCGYVPHDWDEHQCLSDDATERKRAYRAKLKREASQNVPGHVPTMSQDMSQDSPETRPDFVPSQTETETETETEIRREEIGASAPFLLEGKTPKKKTSPMSAEQTTWWDAYINLHPNTETQATEAKALWAKSVTSEEMYRDLIGTLRAEIDKTDRKDLILRPKNWLVNYLTKYDSGVRRTVKPERKVAYFNPETITGKVEVG